MGCQKQGRLGRSELETTESFGTLHQLFPSFPISAGTSKSQPQYRISLFIVFFD
jgi:hypothetical protein